jgi:hypothetical protein
MKVGKLTKRVSITKISRIIVIKETINFFSENHTGDHTGENVSMYEVMGRDIDFPCHSSCIYIAASVL